MDMPATARVWLLGQTPREHVLSKVCSETVTVGAGVPEVLAVLGPPGQESEELGVTVSRCHLVPLRSGQWPARRDLVFTAWKGKVAHCKVLPSSGDVLIEIKRGE
jgi:hypothetical protein